MTAIKYIFNNFWDKLDVCLLFKGNQDDRMIGLSTRVIFLWWYCTVKTDSSTVFLFLKYEEPSLQHCKYGFLPMQRSSKYTYWYSFKLKNELQLVAVVRVQKNERLFIALILSSAFLDIKKLLIYCTWGFIRQ